MEFLRSATMGGEPCLVQPAYAGNKSAHFARDPEIRMHRHLLARSIALALTVAPLPLFAAPPAGEPDPTFGLGSSTPGIVRRGFDLGDTPPLRWNDWAGDMTQDSQGRLILAGYAERDSGYCVGLMRFTADGLPDTDFGVNGKTCLDTLGEILINNRITARSDGGMYLFAQDFQTLDLRVCSVSPQGLPIETFGTDMSGCVTLADIHLDFSEGNVLVGDDTLFFVANHHDGTHSLPVLQKLDPSSGAIIPFGNNPYAVLFPAQGDTHPVVYDATLTTDGRLVVAGRIDAGIDDSSMLIAAFNPQDGTPTEFAGSGLLSINASEMSQGYEHATSIESLDDNTLLVAGSYAIAPGRNGIAIARLHADSGALDDSHGDPIIMHDPCTDSPDGCFLTVKRATLTASGDIAIGGEVGDGGEGGHMFAARLRPDGSPDSDFGSPLGIRHLDDIGLGESEARNMIVQGERIVLGGWATKAQILITGDPPQYQQVKHADFALIRLSDGHLFKDEFESP